MPITIVKQRPDTADAMQLIAELEAALVAEGYPQASRHGYSIEKLLREGVAFFVVRDDEQAAACGGVQLFGTAGPTALPGRPEYGELKRMYVRPQYRRRGLGKLLLSHLAEYARQQGAPVLRLETGIYQTAAIELYQGFGFRRRGPFGSYVDDPLSIYYEKQIV